MPGLLASVPDHDREPVAGSTRETWRVRYVWKSVFRDAQAYRGRHSPLVFWLTGALLALMLAIAVDIVTGHDIRVEGNN
jgi:hypothetical protein